jgi:hypothetical protein
LPLFAPLHPGCAAQGLSRSLTIAEGRIIQENRARNFVAEYTHTLSPSMVLTGRIGFARTLFVFSNQGLGFKPSSLGSTRLRLMGG